MTPVTITPVRSVPAGACGVGMGAGVAGWPTTAVAAAPAVAVTAIMVAVAALGFVATAVAAAWVACKVSVTNGIAVASPVVAAGVTVGGTDVVPGRGVADGPAVELLVGVLVWVAVGVLVGGGNVGTVCRSDSAWPVMKELNPNNPISTNEIAIEKIILLDFILPPIFWAMMFDKTIFWMQFM